jgi:hypothetical protein
VNAEIEYANAKQQQDAEHGDLEVAWILDTGNDVHARYKRVFLRRWVKLQRKLVFFQ